MPFCAAVNRLCNGVMKLTRRPVVLAHGLCMKHNTGLTLNPSTLPSAALHTDATLLALFQCLHKWQDRATAVAPGAAKEATHMAISRLMGNRVPPVGRGCCYGPRIGAVPTLLCCHSD